MTQTYDVVVVGGGMGGVADVLIDSRCIGTSHEAFIAVRMMPHVAEYGRAAGLTAARAQQTGRPIREADVAWVQQKLATLDVR